MFVIGDNCDIHTTARINVKEGYIGEGAIIREGVIIEGTKVCIGREAYIDRFSVIGGGSCFDPDAYLIAGDWFHMGWNSQVNIAFGVKVGDEVGIGIESKIFTHGAYIDSYNIGAPVQWASVEIGNNVWLPNAWVNPGVRIGDNVVVSARSLVNRNIPSGSLCAGIPIRIIKENYFPRLLSNEEKRDIIEKIFYKIRIRFEDISDGEEYELKYDDRKYVIICMLNKKSCFFYLREKIIDGYVTKLSRIVKDQLRRNGIRFRYKESGEFWEKWSENDKIRR